MLNAACYGGRVGYTGSRAIGFVGVGVRLKVLGTAERVGRIRSATCSRGEPGTEPEDLGAAGQVGEDLFSRLQSREIV